MSLTVALSERVRNLLTHANLKQFIYKLFSGVVSNVRILTILKFVLMTNMKLMKFLSFSLNINFTFGKYC